MPVLPVRCKVMQTNMQNIFLLSVICFINGYRKLHNKKLHDMYLSYILLQSTLQPFWVLACSTIVEYSQQEGFYRVPLPAAHQIPNLEDQWLECSNSRHREPQHLKRCTQTPAAEGGTMGEKLPRILPKVATFTSLLGSFTCRKFTTWDRWLYFPSKGRRAEDFFAWKIRRLRPGLNPRTRVPKASTLTSRPPKPLSDIIRVI